MSEPLKVTMTGPVAHLRFARPERMNVLDIAMAQAFGAAVARVLDGGVARVLVMSGEGRNFMAGGDLTGFRDTDDKPGFVRAAIDPLHGALKALAASDVITIAAAHGRIGGGGVSLVAQADLTLAAEGTSFTFAYTRIAGAPDCGGSWALPRAIGLKAAMEMALLNEAMPADQALRLGLINRIVPPEALEAEAMALAARIAEGPRVSQGQAKRLIRQSFDTGFADQLDAERAAFLNAAAQPDFAEGVLAFLERRAPRFQP